VTIIRPAAAASARPTDDGPYDHAFREYRLQERHFLWLKRDETFDF